MNIGFEANDYETDALRCPHCDTFYLSHKRVEVFERTEDAGTGLHVSVSAGSTTIDADLSGNPSARRNGIRVAFHCEGCGVELSLAISQHKGASFVEWEK